jgi:hypothetical protein
MGGFKVLSVAGVLAAALVVGPGLSWAAHVTSQTDLLLKDIQSGANVVSTQADNLDALHRSGVDWQINAANLEAMKSVINAMTPKIARLEEMRGGVDAVQGKEIDRVGLLFRELAANTNAAINYLNDNKSSLRGSAYTEYVGRLDSEAQQISRSLGEYFGLVAAQAKELRLQKDLGVVPAE